MLDCDIFKTKFLNTCIDQKPQPIDDLPSKKPHKRLNKNSLKTINLNIVSYRYFGGVIGLKLI